MKCCVFITVSPKATVSVGAIVAWDCFSALPQIATKTFCLSTFQQRTYCHIEEIVEYLKTDIFIDWNKKRHESDFVQPGAGSWKFTRYCGSVWLHKMNQWSISEIVKHGFSKRERMERNSANNNKKAKREGSEKTSGYRERQMSWKSLILIIVSLVICWFSSRLHCQSEDRGGFAPGAEGETVPTINIVKEIFGVDQQRWWRAL